MIYLLILVYMIIFPVTTIAMLYKILDKLEKEKANIERTQKRKTHPSIAKSNYTSVLTGRKSMPEYEKYKNKDGLYEPIKPKNGIEIKKRED